MKQKLNTLIISNKLHLTPFCRYNTLVLRYAYTFLVFFTSVFRKEHELKLYDIAKDREMCVINTKEDYFDTDTIVIIGSWGLNLLAYTIPLMDDGEAALVKIDINTMSTSKLQSWDLSVFWTHRSLIYHKGNFQFQTFIFVYFY